jgi:hypothetical protein
MKTRTETITPELAEEYLKHNWNNRTLNWRTVARFADDMENKRWHLTHQGIGFANNGELIDGQHRLQAIVRSGVAVEMQVTRDMESVARLNIDMQGARSQAHSISIATGERISNSDMATAKNLISLLHGRNKLTPSQLIPHLDELRPGIDYANKIYPTKVQFLGAAPVKAAFVAAYYYEPDLAPIERFSLILSGKDYPQDQSESAAAKLRERILQLGSLTAFSQRMMGMFMSMRAIKLFRQGQKVSRLATPSKAEYPYPLTDNRVR